MGYAQMKVVSTRGVEKHMEKEVVVHRLFVDRNNKVS